MKDRILNLLTARELKRICDEMLVKSTKEDRRSRKRMIELAKKMPYRKIKAAIYRE